MLISMSFAPRPATMRAASAIQCGSQPASCTAVFSTLSPSSAFSRVPGLACTISWLATISLTTSPAPNCDTIDRKGRSVIPAIGASTTGGFNHLLASDSMFVPNRCATNGL